MGPAEHSSQVARADLRGWLEAAILSSNAALPVATPSPQGSDAGVKHPKIAGDESVITEPVIPEAFISQPAIAQPAVAQPAITAPIGRELQVQGTHNRKLATVRRITAIKSINRGNNVVSIDGWKVVAEKADWFGRGQYVVYFEVDSFLPSRSEFEDLFADAGSLINYDGEEGYRVGTSVWKAQDGSEIISQGHICRLADFPDIDKKICDLHWELFNLTELEFADVVREIDFTAELGIKKWEHISALDENSLSIPTSNPKPPSFVIKTDTERVQNCPNLFTKAKYQRLQFQESLKMDGASTTVYFIPNTSSLYSTLPPLPTISPSNIHTFVQHAVHPTGRLGVCTRNQDLLPHLLPSKTTPSHNLYWTAALAANLHTLLPSLNTPIALQFELVGHTIQGNPYSYPPGTHKLGMQPPFSAVSTPPGHTFTPLLLLPHSLNKKAITNRAPVLFSIHTPGPVPGSKRWHPRKVETFAAEHGLEHVPVLGYHTVREVARNHDDLMVRAELKKGEGLVFKSCAVDGRWFKVLSNRWIVEKGDEMLAKGKGKGKGKKVGVVAKKKERERGVGWQMDQEGVKELLDIWDNLVEVMKRDFGLTQWVEDWKRELGDGKLDFGPEGNAKLGLDANGRNGQSAMSQKTDGAGGVNGKAGGVNIASGTDNVGGQKGQKTSGFGITPEKRKELEDWLGINGSAL